MIAVHVNFHGSLTFVGLFHLALSLTWQYMWSWKRRLLWKVWRNLSRYFRQYSIPFTYMLYRTLASFSELCYSNYRKKPGILRKEVKHTSYLVACRWNTKTKWVCANLISYNIFLNIIMICGLFSTLQGSICHWYIYIWKNKIQSYFSVSNAVSVHVYYKIIIICLTYMYEYVASN